ncbi:MAG: ribosome rescue protein RqcH [Candidatus Helarchaeota archaeon]
MKETISSFDLAAIISEIQEECIGAIINNVYQIDNIFILKLKTRLRTINLLIEPAKRIHTTEYQRTKPKFPPKFCMTLRKYLRRKVIIKFKQYKFDRVLIIEVARRHKNHETGEIEYSEKNFLICEFFNRGMLFLLNEMENVIIANKYTVLKDRRIIPNRKFEFAPVRGLNLYEFKYEELLELSNKSNKSVANFLASEVGIGGKYATECCLRLDINKKETISKLDSQKIKEIYLLLKRFIDKIVNNKINPRIIYENNSAIGFEPFELMVDKQFKAEIKDNYNSLLDDFFSKNEQLETVETEIDKTSSKISKQEKIIQFQKETIKKLEKKVIDYKEFGDLTYQYLNVIQDVLNSFKAARDKGYSWSEIKEQIKNAKKQKNFPLINYIADIKPSEGIVVFKFGEKLIPINFRETPQKNANEFYTISKKSQKKIEGAKKALELSLKNLEKSKIEKEVVSTSFKQIIKKRKLKWYEKYHWFNSSDNFLVIGGRDLKTNEILFRKYLDKDDLFLHADIRGSPAVIIKNKGGKIPENTIIEAAQFTVIYSSAWKSKYMSADAYWVNKNQVSQAPPTGQYLPKGSFMIRGKKNYIKNLSLELAIGLLEENSEFIPIAGPINAVKKQTTIYLKIKPGNKKRSEIAKEIKKFFIENVKDAIKKDKIRQISLDEIIRILPGEAEIIGQ